MISGKIRTMALGRVKHNWIPAFLTVVLLGSIFFTGYVIAADEFEDIWTEGPDGPPRQMELSKERLDQLVKHISQGNGQREKQLRELYNKDRDKFWSEAKEFFRKQHEEGGLSEGDRRGGPGRGARNGQSGSRSSRWREQLQKRHDDFIDWLKDNFPEVEKDLAQYRENQKPEEYFKRFSAVKDKYEHVMSTQRRNPELASVMKVEIELTDYRNELLNEFHRSDDKKRRKELVKQLTEVVGSRFDLIVRKKQLQFEELHRRLEKLQKELENREKELGNLIESKDEATKNRVQTLLNPKQKVDWK